MKFSFLSVAFLACVVALSSTASAQTYQALDTSQAQVIDSAGQQWQHPDGAYLLSWVASRNTSLVGSAATYLTTGRAVQAAPQVYRMTVTATPTVGDPWGFGTFLNNLRARYGLPGVTLDAGLCSDAASNNAQQQIRGMGHHFFGHAKRQNSGMGGSSMVIFQMWQASRDHLSAMVDPSITRYGIANNGIYWTYSAY